MDFNLGKVVKRACLQVFFIGQDAGDNMAVRNIIV